MPDNPYPPGPTAWDLHLAALKERRDVARDYAQELLDFMRDEFSKGGEAVRAARMDGTRSPAWIEGAVVETRTRYEEAVAKKRAAIAKALAEATEAARGRAYPARGAAYEAARARMAGELAFLIGCPPGHQVKVLRGFLPTAGLAELDSMGLYVRARLADEGDRSGSPEAAVAVAVLAVDIESARRRVLPAAEVQALEELAGLEQQADRLAKLGLLSPAALGRLDASDENLRTEATLRAQGISAPEFAQYVSGGVAAPMGR